MQIIKSILRDNKPFFLLLLFLLVSSTYFLLGTTKTNGFFLLNTVHSFWTNVFFVNYTFFGDGIFSLGLCAFLYYRNQKILSATILIAFVSSGVCAQVLKNIIYEPRPQLYFEATQYRFIIDGWGNSGSGSNGFPSGHTTSAFALAVVLSAHYKKKFTSIALFFGALLVGYSRIYLAMHFPIDVVAGAFIGSFFGVGALFVVQLRKNNKLKTVHQVKVKEEIYFPSLQTAM
jgi:membrane-associated phospholipid phosphatase